jgi:hypothetical protein
LAVLLMSAEWLITLTKRSQAETSAGLSLVALNWQVVAVYYPIWCSAINIVTSTIIRLSTHCSQVAGHSKIQFCRRKKGINFDNQRL